LAARLRLRCLLFLSEDGKKKEGIAFLDRKNPSFLQTAQKGWGTLKHWWWGVYNFGREELAKLRCDTLIDARRAGCKSGGEPPHSKKC